MRKSDVPTIQNCFPYLFDVSKVSRHFFEFTFQATGSGYVSSIEFTAFDESEAVLIEGLEFIPLVVEHGPSNTCLGYRFGDILYISDVSGIPDSTRQLFKPKHSDRIELLIIDALRKENAVSSHYSFKEALEEIRKIKPKKTHPFVLLLHTDTWIFDWNESRLQLLHI